MFTARYNSLYLIQGAAHGIFIQKEKKLEPKIKSYDSVKSHMSSWDFSPSESRVMFVKTLLSMSKLVKGPMILSAPISW